MDNNTSQNKRKIIIIDETMREGMQYKGVMFSLAQRLKIIEFQEKLKVDICQAGYPSAHNSEADIANAIYLHAKNNNYKIRVAALGRANVQDAAILLKTNVKDIHFHLHIKNSVTKERLNHILDDLLKTFEFVRKQTPQAVISIAMMEMGKSDDEILERCMSFLRQNHIDIISLPDTSGGMCPDQVYKRIKQFSLKSGSSGISIHCHNDMGMASGNSIMGIIAGAKYLEASALGIGERNGIADLYCTAKLLKDRGFDINLNTEDLKTFKAYYQYIDSIVHEQTREHILNANTPAFGDGVKTHVAGTHAKHNYGMCREEKYYLNILCGHSLVQQYLEQQNILYNKKALTGITLKVKEESLIHGRCLTRDEIRKIALVLQ